MVSDWLHSFFIAEVSTLMVGHKCWSLSGFLVVVDPLDGSGAAFIVGRQGLDWSHLRVDESVSEEKLITCKCGLLVAELVPLGGDVQTHLVGQTRFIGRQLVDESGSDFQVGAPRVQELERLEQRPLVLAHDVGGEGAGGSALAPH